MYAYAIHTIMNPKLIGVGKQATAGTVFATDKDEFDRLEPLNAVRKPTDEEIAVAKTNGTFIAAPKGGDTEETQTNASEKAPDSGDDNDPNSRPKGAGKTKAAGKAKAADEEI